MLCKGTIWLEEIQNQTEGQILKIFFNPEGATIPTDYFSVVQTTLKLSLLPFFIYVL